MLQGNLALLRPVGKEDLHRIYLCVFAENKRAIHAYEKVGFVHEANLREAEWRHGRWQDMLYMSVLRREWR